MCYHLLFDPFINHNYMCKAIIACLFLSVSNTLLGGLLSLRRMSLVCDALSHAMLPGIALGYFFYGMSFIIMSIGGFCTAFLVSVISVLINTQGALKEDANFAGLYLGSLSLGVILISKNGYNIDLLHMLFGSVVLIDIYAIKCIGFTTGLTLLIIACFYREFVIEAFDPNFLKINSSSYYSKLIQILFLFLVVFNLVASFQVIGTLMSIGLMILPSLSAQCWSERLPKIFLISICISIFCSYIGLIISFHFSLPAGATIVLCASVFFVLSMLWKRRKLNCF